MGTGNSSPSRAGKEAGAAVRGAGTGAKGDGWAVRRRGCSKSLLERRAQRPRVALGGWAAPGPGTVFPGPSAIPLERADNVPSHALVLLRCSSLSCSCGAPMAREAGCGRGSPDPQGAWLGLGSPDPRLPRLSPSHPGTGRLCSPLQGSPVPGGASALSPPSSRLTSPTGRLRAAG